MRRLSRTCWLFVTPWISACGAAEASPDTTDPIDTTDTSDTEGDGDETSPSDTEPGDTSADVPDGDPSDDIARLDWTAERGPALATTEVSLSERALFAVHGDGFVTVSGCSAEQGCDYAWLDGAGEDQGRKDDRLAVYGTVVSPSAREMLVLAGEGIEDCGPGPTFPIIASGVLEVIDLASGAVTFSQTLRTRIYYDPAFTNFGGWFRVSAVPPDACVPPGDAWRAATPPHDVSVYADPAFFPALELPDGRWVGQRGDELGIAEPSRANSFVGLGDGTDDVAVGGGWLHAFDGYGDLTEVDHAVEPGGRRWDLRLPETGDFRGSSVWGRSLLACTSRGAERGVRECAVFDVTEQRAPRTLDLMGASRRPAVFIAEGDALVFLSYADQEIALERLDLETGVVTRLADGPGTLYPIGDGAAALWESETGVLLVERDRTELLVAGTVAQLLVAPEVLGAPPGLASVRQRWLAVIVVTRAADEHTLLLFDLATRRLATLTDRLYFAPNIEAPLAPDDCGQPWTLRSAGWPADGLVQSARFFFFVERTDSGTDMPLFVVPSDLGAPPRRLTAMHPTYCHAPLASPDGSLVVVDVDDYDGLTSRFTLARP